MKQIRIKVFIYNFVFKYFVNGDFSSLKFTGRLLNTNGVEDTSEDLNVLVI
jgi:hypothetical protein